MAYGSPVSRRRFVTLAAGATLAAAGPLATRVGAEATGSSASGGGLVYVGTYTEASSNGKAEGIYVFRLNPSTGALTPVQTVRGVQNPSFLALAPSGRALYSVNELTTGGVSAFAVDPATGVLTFLNRQSSLGANPAHISVDPTGQYVLVANYSSGNAMTVSIQSDGRLGNIADNVPNTGTGPNATRQEGAHAHMIATDRAGGWTLLADLGADKVYVYRLDTLTGRLLINGVIAKVGQGGQPFTSLPPGSGPRHFAFHPNGRLVYVINELASTITTMNYDALAGTLTPIQTISTLPAGFAGMSTTAEIIVHPNGKFVYGSNRGHDSIAIFAVSPTDGTLAAVGYEPTQGKTPRSFNIDPSGTLLLAANQASDTIVPFRIDGTTGKLTATGATTRVPTPVCILFR